MRKDISTRLPRDPWLVDSQIRSKPSTDRSTCRCVPMYAELVGTHTTPGESAAYLSGQRAVSWAVGETLVDADLAARCVDALDADRSSPRAQS